MSFSPNELEGLHMLVAWRIAKYGDETSAKQWEALLAKIASERAAAQPGVLVFRLELPTEPFPITRGRTTMNLHLAPTMNEYASQKGWMRDMVRKTLDNRIATAKLLYPRWSCDPTKKRRYVPDRLSAKRKVIKGGMRETVIAGARRLVRVTRRSSRRLDEPSTDAIGGKIPIDRLKIADVIAGDSAKWIDRQALWEPVEPGHGCVIVEVFALSGESMTPAKTGTKRARKR